MSKLFHTKSKKIEGSKQRVFIAIPTYDGGVNAPCLHSLVQSFEKLTEAKIEYDFLILAGNCSVDDARNGCVREFMLTDCTDLMFIDADVGFRPQDLVKILGYDRDIVAGVYPKKTDEEEYPVHMPGGEIWSEADGLVEVRGAPTGFMRIRRNVLEKMCEAFKDRRFYGQNPKDQEHPYTILFERTLNEGLRLSGDYAFCFKWGFMGGKVYVDPEMPFVHEGLKEWGGTLGDYWRRIHGVYENEAKIAVQRLRNHDESMDVFTKMVAGYDNPFSATAEYLATIYKLALNTKGTILECGSGLTTLVLAIAAEKTGNKLISLEHEPGWCAKTINLLAGFGLNTDLIDIRFAPLKEFDGYKWYDAETLPDCALVVCDGPQRKHGRQGLYKVASNSISNAVIVADDADDKNELNHINEWSLKNGREVTVLGEQRQFAISLRKAA